MRAKPGGSPSPRPAIRPPAKGAMRYDTCARSLKSVQFLDGSDVGIEQQVTEVAKNQFLHNLSLSIMTSQFRLLQAAISERV